MALTGECSFAKHLSFSLFCQRVNAATSSALSLTLALCAGERRGDCVLLHRNKNTELLFMHGKVFL